MSKARELPKNQPYFEIAYDPESKEWMWCLWTANNRQAAHSAISYPTQDATRKAIRALQAMQLARMPIMAVRMPTPGETNAAPEAPEPTKATESDESNGSDMSEANPL